MKFTTLFSTLLLSIIGTLLLLHSAPASASPDCKRSCGNANTWCAAKARDRLLGFFGCIRKPDSVFLYNGGRTVAHVPGTPCKAVFSTPADMQIYLPCSEVRARLNRVKGSCFSPGGRYGLGTDTEEGRHAGITACDSSARRIRVIRKRKDDGGGDGGEGEEEEED